MSGKPRRPDATDVATPRPARSPVTSGAVTRNGPESALGAGTPPLFDAALFLYLPFLAAASLAFANTTDDPFITLRYAANFVHGYGLSFNNGQAVQGYTSPLHLAVAVLSYLAPGSHALLKLKLASLLFGFLAVRESGRLIYSMEMPRWARRTGSIAVGACSVIAFSSSNGLETTLELWLLMALTRRLVVNGPNQSPLVLAGFSFAAVLARPDALLPIVFLGAFSLLIEQPLSIWRRIRWVVGGVVAALSTAVFSLAYFGNALPTTYYAKDAPVARAFHEGYLYLIHSLQPGSAGGTNSFKGVSIALLIVQLIFLASGIFAIVRRFRRCGYLVAIVLAQSLFVLMVGGDWMNGGRFIAPAAIPFILIELLGIVNLAAYIRDFHHPTITESAVTVGIAALIAVSVFPLVVLHAPVWTIHGVDDLALVNASPEPVSPIWSLLPAAVRCLQAGQWMATSEVGYVGFVRQDINILDLRGLTDQVIAEKSPSVNKYSWGVDDPQLLTPSSIVGQAILRQKPSIVATMDAPVERSALGGSYRLVGVTSAHGYVMGIYVPSSSRWSCPAAGLSIGSALIPSWVTTNEQTLAQIYSTATAITNCVSTSSSDACLGSIGNDCSTLLAKADYAQGLPGVPDPTGEREWRSAVSHYILGAQECTDAVKNGDASLLQEGVPSLEAGNTDFLRVIKLAGLSVTRTG